MRYLSLDFFRGLTIALMIVVNNPGTWQSIYDPLEHADWHGCTPTDLVFPFFLFIVGVALWFSFSKFNQQLTPALTRKILRRAALIFLIGLALNAFPFFNKNWSELRILGVLQHMAWHMVWRHFYVSCCRGKCWPSQRDFCLRVTGLCCTWAAEQIHTHWSLMLYGRST